MKPNYDRDGLRFCYPENWSIVDENFQDWPRTVSAQSPNTAIWMAHWYADCAAPQDLAAETLKALRDEYDDVEAAIVSESVEDVDVVGYDVSFYYMDLIASAAIRCFRVGSSTVVVLCQAEDREFDELQPVFEAITISLIRCSELAAA